MKLNKKMGFNRNKEQKSERLIITEDVKNIKIEFKDVLETIGVSKGEKKYNLNSFDLYRFEKGLEVGFPLTNGKVIFVGQTKNETLMIGLVESVKNVMKVYDDVCEDTQDFGKVFSSTSMWRIYIR